MTISGHLVPLWSPHLNLTLALLTFNSSSVFGLLHNTDVNICAMAAPSAARLQVLRGAGAMSRASRVFNVQTALLLAKAFLS